MILLRQCPAAWLTSLPLRFAALCLLALPSIVGAQIVYTYEDRPGTPVTITNNSCGTGGGIIRTFAVTNSFTVADIGVGFEVRHARAGQVLAVLTAPGGTTFTVIPNLGNDPDVNYNVTMTSNAEASPSLNTDDDDPSSATSLKYRRIVNTTGINFYTGNAVGTWSLRICDNHSTETGTYVGARLILRDATAVVAPVCGSSSTYDWGSNGNNVVFVSATVDDVTISRTSVPTEATADDGVNAISFRTSTGTTGNHTGFYQLQMNTTGDTELSFEQPSFTFSQPVAGLTFNVLDLDANTSGIADVGYEDTVRIDGFDESGNFVAKRIVPANAQASLAGDWVEADASVLDTATDGNVAYTFLGAVKTLRVHYAQGNDNPQLNSGFQAIGLSDFSFCAYDYGDAPTTYQVAFANTGPRHGLDARALFLGTAPDGETDGTPSAAANADGADEDSMTLPTEVALPTPHFECGTYSTAVGEFCVTVSVTNNLTSAAQLVGWLDVNADGDFNDANERSIPRLGGGAGGAADATFTTGNIAASSTGNRVLVWAGLTTPVTEAATFMRLRVTTDATFFSDASPSSTGLVTNGEVEDHPIPAGTLPVTLAYVRSTVVGDRLDIEFATATESENVGFSIEEKPHGQWHRLHSGLVESASTNSTESRRYDITQVALPASGKFFIVDHDIRGRRRVHGPFAVGATIGKPPSIEAIDWRGTRAALDSMKRTRAKGLSDSAKLWVSQPGFHRVTAAMLLAAGVDFSGVPADQIAIRFRGEAVARRVSTANGVFGSGSFIDFAVSPAYSLYTAEFPYLVAADGVAVRPISSEPAVPEIATDAWYWAEARYSPDLLYNFGSPTNDPWYAKKLTAFPGQPATFTTTLNVNGLAVTDLAAELFADMIGVTDWAGAGQDHHVRLLVAGQVVGEAHFDGQSSRAIEARLPNLVAGNVSVAVQVVGDTGFAFDQDHIEALRLRYPRLPIVESDRLAIDALQSSYSLNDHTSSDDSGALFRSDFEDALPVTTEGFLVSGLSSNDIVAYIGRGDDWRWLESAQADAGVAMLPADTGSAYWISTTAALHAPRIESISANEAITSGSADYLIITHPLFINDLQPLVTLQQSRGLTTKVVDVQQIYAQFGHHVPQPAAIQQYLNQVVGPMGVEYVLLVGADTYDYKNFLGTGSVSFVPTHYVAVGTVVRYAPADAVFADPDGDGVPSFAIGRLPVRTVAELNNLVAKIVSITGTTPDHKLFLAAQASDDIGDYDTMSEQFATTLPGAWNVSRAYVDTLGVAPARAALKAALDTQQTLISYVGHSASTQWSFDPLLNVADVNAATGIADLVVQWGCWNSYFVSPTANTLSHAFLNAPGRGAAGVIGVSSLSEMASHEALADALYPLLSVGTRIGDAFRAAKTQLATQGSTHRDVLLTATLLGDPAMPIR